MKGSPCEDVPTNRRDEPGIETTVTLTPNPSPSLREKGFESQASKMFAARILGNHDGHIPLVVWASVPGVSPSDDKYRAV